MRLRNFLDLLLKKIIVKDENEQNKKISKKYIITLFILGIMFMIISNLFSRQENTEDHSLFTLSEQDELEEESVETFLGDNQKTNTTNDYKERYETDLENILNNMAGISQVQVIVSLGASERTIHETNTTTSTQKTQEEDTQGGVRSIDNHSISEEVVIINQNGEEVPVIIQTEAPEIRGVLVVAKGVENLSIKERVIESITRVLDIPRHRVSVQPREQ